MHRCGRKCTIWGHFHCKRKPGLHFWAGWVGGWAAVPFLFFSFLFRGGAGVGAGWPAPFKNLCNSLVFQWSGAGGVSGWAAVPFMYVSFLFRGGAGVGAGWPAPFKNLCNSLVISMVWGGGGRRLGSWCVYVGVLSLSGRGGCRGRLARPPSNLCNFFILHWCGAVFAGGRGRLCVRSELC